MTDAHADAKLLYAAWAVLTGADSVLSEIVHRYPSRLPDEVRDDATKAYIDCRKWAARIRQRAEQLDPAFERARTQASQGSSDQHEVARDPGDGA